MLTAKQIEEAREWLKDCTFRDLEDSCIDELSPRAVEYAVGRYWDGGLEDFVICCGGES